MWLDRYSVVCQQCPDVVAAYEAPDGRIALLLRHTLVPLPRSSRVTAERPEAQPVRRPTGFGRVASAAASWCCSGSLSERLPT